MAEARKNPQRDPLQLAKLIDDIATGRLLNTVESKSIRKNADAVDLGRLAGLESGRAGAERITAKQRSDIARKPARARYSKKP